MKSIIIATIVLLPCLAAFGESDTFWPNIFGLAYMFALTVLCKTEKGKKFLRKLYRETYTGSDTRMK